MKQTEGRKAKITKFVINLAKGAYAMPRLAFNKKLYHKLVKEVTDKHNLSSGEPSVEFAQGPIDGVLGTFNHKTKVIEIDYLEIFLFCLLSFPANQEELAERFARSVTNTLAHEGGHWQLDIIEGKKAVLNSFYLLGFFFIICLLPFLWINSRIIHLSLEKILSLYAQSFEMGITIGSVVGLVGVCSMFAMTFVGLIISLLISRSLTYKFCKHERYARAFAEEAQADERWQGIIRCNKDRIE